MSDVEVSAREAEAGAARAKFLATLHELQRRLSPKSIVSDVKDKAKEKADGAMNAAKEGVAQAATHPSTIAAITVPVLAYLFRKPLARGLNALFPRNVEEEDVQPFEIARQPAPLATEPIRVLQEEPAEQGA